MKDTSVKSSAQHWLHPVPRGALPTADTEALLAGSKTRLGEHRGAPMQVHPALEKPTPIWCSEPTPTPLKGEVVCLKRNTTVP